jgi:GNAT superfamily N-acetyltransferase
VSKLAGGPWPASLDLEVLRLPDGFRARPAAEVDRASYVELSHATLGRFARDLRGLSDDAIRIGLRSEFEPQLAIVIERGAECVGLMVVEEHSSELWLDHMLIDPSEQNHGIGTALVRWVQDAATLDATSVALSVVDGNPALRLYERLGFAVVRVEPPRTFMEWHRNSA